MKYGEAITRNFVDLRKLFREEITKDLALVTSRLFSKLSRQSKRLVETCEPLGGLEKERLEDG